MDPMMCDNCVDLSDSDMYDPENHSLDFDRAAASSGVPEKAQETKGESEDDGPLDFHLLYLDEQETGEPDVQLNVHYPPLNLVYRPPREGQAVFVNRHKKAAVVLSDLPTSLTETALKVSPPPVSPGAGHLRRLLPGPDRAAAGRERTHRDGLPVRTPLLRADHRRLGPQHRNMP